MKTSEIKITVAVDDQFVPEVIEWEATDSGIGSKRPCKATLFSVWDPSENTTLRIDLWTKDMPVDDMKRFFFENMASLADTYMRATNDEKGAKHLRDAAQGFATASGISGSKK
ncbi:MAG: gliding motility protein GldC [Bacteroidota bacterium]